MRSFHLSWVPRALLPVAVAGLLWLIPFGTESQASVDGVTFVYEFPKPTVLKAGETASRVEMPGLWKWGPPGLPVLPCRTAFILLPPLSDVESVSVTAEGWRDLPGRYTLEHGQRPVPLSRREPVTATPADSRVFSSDEAYPPEAGGSWSVQEWRGHSILVANLVPMRYFPASGRLQWAPRIAVTYSTRERSPMRSAVLRISGQPSDLLYLARQVDNPEDVAAYARMAPSPDLSEGTFLDPGLAYDYVVIASPELAAYSGAHSLDDFVALKESQGLACGVVDTDWIEANYSGARPDGGADDQTRIRNFIIDAYNTWGTRYVLLLGDADGADVGGESGDCPIPHRGFLIDEGFWAYDDDIASDMYYGCLDGSFDYDGDGFYGEPNDGPGGGEVDLLADVHVGRAPADSTAELANFVSKQLDYTQSAQEGQVLMVGEYVGFGGVAEWGGNYKDEILDGSDAYGYSTVGFTDSPFSSTYEARTLYDRDDPANDWAPSTLIAEINNGLDAINHLGHADVSYVMKLFNSQVDSLSNTAYFVGYSQGCYAGSFDNRSTGPGDYSVQDCIAEHFTCGAHGAVAFLANSRYGWGEFESTDGPSQHFDREFWDAILGEGIRSVGEANDDSKWDQAGYVSADGYGRWCCYEITLFGDPHLAAKIGVSSMGAVGLDETTYSTSGVAQISVFDTDLDGDELLPDEVEVEVTSTTETTPEVVTCVETGNSTGIFQGAITLATGSPAADGQLQVAHGDTITVRYVDASDGQGGTDITRTDTATVDGQAPSFAGLASAQPNDGYVVLSWSAAGDATPPVKYNIYRGDAAGGQDFETPLGSTYETSYRDESVVNWQSYYYVVRAEDAVGNEDANSVERGVTPRELNLVHSFPLTSDPGWEKEEGWQFGVPQGLGSYCHDPGQAHTGANVYGYNLFGDYPVNLSASYLTTTAIDCSGLASVSLHFWRHLGVESSWYDAATVEVSRDAVTWETVWVNSVDSICDSDWVLCTYDISETAAGQSTVYVRWGMGPTDYIVTFPGWNIDDVEIWGLPHISSEGYVSFDRRSYAASAVARVVALDIDLDVNETAPDEVEVEVTSTTETTPEVVTCVETGNSTGIFQSTIALVAGSPAADGQLQVAHGDTITVRYVDASDGQGGTDIVRTDTASVDGQAPTFAGLSSAEPYDGYVVLSWSAAGDTTPPVKYNIYRSSTPGGQDFGAPLGSIYETSYRDESVVNWQSYYYVVRAEDAVGNEDANSVERGVTPRGLNLVYSFPLDVDPGWVTQGDWQFGAPAGGGSYCEDPVQAHTGANVYGYNLLGDYPNELSARYLTTTAMDCSGLASVSLRFWRHLGVEDAYYDHAAVQVSADGASWTNVWEHTGYYLCDASWVQCTYDISEVAAGQPTVYVRWQMGPTDYTVTFPGWNIDDIEIWGLVSVGPAGAVAWDREAYAGSDVAQVMVRDTDLDINEVAQDEVAVLARSDTEPGGKTVICSELGVHCGVFAGTIELAEGAAAPDGKLQVADGDTITVSYLDVSDGSGGSNITRQDTAAIDARGPDFAGVSLAQGGDCTVVLHWSAAADDTPPVLYKVYRAETSGDENFSSPIGTTYLTEYRDTGLVNGQIYYYVVRAEDAVGNEETNTVECDALPETATAIYRFPMDTNPGWYCGGGWAFGVPEGSGSWCGDPSGGHTGTMVYGYNLYGDYANNLFATCLTTSPLGCAHLTSVSLRFWRWLGVESSWFDEAAVEASPDGSNWYTLWSNSEEDLCDGEWVRCEYDVSSLADGNPHFWVRWRMGPTDYLVTYPGWNIDDVEIWGVPLPNCFSDVPVDYWAFDEIRACSRAGIVSGYVDGSYQPTISVSRDQMAVFVARAVAGGDASVPDNDGPATFPDVPVGHWAFKYIEYVVGGGIVGGYTDGAYHPTVAVDRGQMAVFIARAMAGGDGAVPSYDGTPSFPDVQASFWAYKYVQYIADPSRAVTQGYTDGNYHPEVVVTRDQMAVYIARAFGLND